MAGICYKHSLSWLLKKKLFKAIFDVDLVFCTQKFDFNLNFYKQIKK